MDERKRPAIDNNDSAPPLKRQATSVNGAGKPHIDTDMPWQDDLEVSITRISPSPGLKMLAQSKGSPFSVGMLMSFGSCSASKKRQSGGRCRSIKETVIIWKLG